jgi:hypothetical protein
VAAAVSHEAMKARIEARYVLGGNRLFAYTLRSDDMVVGHGSGRNILLGAHYPVADLTGRAVVGNEIFFALNPPRPDRETLAYLRLADPTNDAALGLHIGIPASHLEALGPIGRELAIEQAAATPPLTLPAVEPVYFL